MWVFHRHRVLGGGGGGQQGGRSDSMTSCYTVFLVSLLSLERRRKTLWKASYYREEGKEGRKVGGGGKK